MHCKSCDAMLNTGKEIDEGYCSYCLKLVEYYEANPVDSDDEYTVDLNIEND